MIKGKMIDMNSVSDAFSLLLHSSYDVYSSLCHSLNVESLTYEQYIDRIRYNLKKNRREKKK